jgi:hypothetical protein
MRREIDRPPPPSFVEPFRQGCGILGHVEGINLWSGGVPFAGGSLG